MKLLKTILLSFIIAVSMGAFSTAAFAEASDGRTFVSFGDAVNGINTNIAEAIRLLNSGETDKAIDEISNALKLSKEINENDKVDVLRLKGNAKLKDAIKAIKAGKLAGNEESAEALLKDAGSKFSGLDALRSK